jgi:hypothetical protein
MARVQTLRPRVTRKILVDRLRHQNQVHEKGSHCGAAGFRSVGRPGFGFGVWVEVLACCWRRATVESPCRGGPPEPHSRPSEAVRAGGSCCASGRVPFACLLNKPGSVTGMLTKNLRFIVFARCLISSVNEGIGLAALTRSRRYGKKFTPSFRAVLSHVSIASPTWAPRLRRAGRSSPPAS